MKILVTGSAGFIGMHVAKALLERGDQVVGFDNFNDYYDPGLKEDRNRSLEPYQGFTLVRADLANLGDVKRVFHDHKIDKVCHLAAQAGVRYSLKNPHVYVQSNIVGFTNLIEEAKSAGIKDFIYASSSSVYGKNEKVPFSITDPVDHPISLYAATKRTNELIAHAYHHLFDMHCTGLRFFTVYGPWGRPDMAAFLFTKAILEETPIKVFNYGKMRRDFTYIDDIVDGVIAAIDKSYPLEIFNLGNNTPVELEALIAMLESALGRKAVRDEQPMQPGDVQETFADIDVTREKLGFEPKTSIEEGVTRFIDWYKNYYHVPSA